MINDIVIGIAQALNGAFGDDYEIYSQEVEQGLKEPCFLILLVDSSNERIIGSRFKRKQPFNILYFSKDDETTNDMYSVGERMNDALEFISFRDGKLMGTEMSFKVIDGVLNFLVDYNFTTIKQIDEEYMKELTVKGRVRVNG